MTPPTPTPQEAEDRKLAEEITAAIVLHHSKDRARAPECCVDVVLPLITAAFSRVREERDSYRQRWIEADAENIARALLAPEPQCSGTKPHAHGVQGECIPGSAPEPQKAKEEPIGQVVARVRAGLDAWNKRRAEEAAPPPPEEPGRHEFVVGKCKNLCSLEDAEGNFYVCYKPASDPVHQMLPPTPAVWRGGTWAAPQPERPAEQEAARLQVFHAHDFAEPCNNACHEIEPEPAAPDRGEGERAEERWKCQARIANTDPPQDCNWPHCGCDPAATRVLEALDEEGWSPPSLLIAAEKFIRYRGWHDGPHSEITPPSFQGPTVNECALCYLAYMRAESEFDAAVARLRSSDIKQSKPQPDSRDALLEECRTVLTALLAGMPTFPHPETPQDAAADPSKVRVIVRDVVAAQALLSRLRARKG